MFGNIMGGVASSAYNGVSPAQQAQSAYPNHAGGLIQNAMYGAVGAQGSYNASMANNAYAQNQAAFAQAAAQQRAFNNQYKPKDFRINGKDMDFKEFLDTLYSDDCPEKTYLALKLAKGDEE